MARRTGIGYSSSRCFSSYRGYDSFDFALYACMVIFLAVYLGALIALCIVRRRTGPGKHLVGLPYIFALAFMFIEQAASFLSTTLRACEISRDMESFYDWNIVVTVFYGINTFLLLFVVIYTLNTMLRKQLGHNPSTLKVAFGLVLFLLGGLLFSFIVLRSYIYWWSGRSYRIGPNDLNIDFMAPTYISLAFDAAFLVSILASGVLSLLAAHSLKKKHGASSSLVFWISVLVLSLVGYSLTSIIQTSTQISFNAYLTSGSIVAMFYLTSLFRAVAFITIIIIAKNPAWRLNTFARNTAEQQYAYNYQQEATVYGGMGQRT